MEWPYPEYYSDNSIIKELRQITKVNEPLNVMSAIYIVLYSTYHLVKSMKSNIYYQLLLILFIANGVSSALAHMTNNPVCIYIDGLTFIIACSLANYSLYQNDLVKLLIIINLMIYIELIYQNNYNKITNSSISKKDIRQLKTFNKIFLI